MRKYFARTYYTYVVLYQTVNKLGVVYVFDMTVSPVTFQIFCKFKIKIKIIPTKYGYDNAYNSKIFADREPNLPTERCLCVCVCGGGVRNPRLPRLQRP